jgi:hypothetical protein
MEIVMTNATNKSKTFMKQILFYIDNKSKPLSLEIAQSRLDLSSFSPRRPARPITYEDFLRVVRRGAAHFAGHCAAQCSAVHTKALPLHPRSGTPTPTSGS